MIDQSVFTGRKALFHTFGCKLNFAGTSTVARLFAEKEYVGYRPGNAPDIVVINTCSVTEVADKSADRRYVGLPDVIPMLQLLGPDARCSA